MKSSPSLSILLVDDHAVVRMGYGMLLGQMDTIAKIIEAENSESAYRLYVTEQPDLVIMDLSLPGAGGLATIRKIVKRDADARILVFSVHDEPIYIKRAMDSGAKGYITKSCSPERLLEALQKVSENDTYIQPELAQKLLIQQFNHHQTESITDQLTAREFEVFLLVAQGNSTQATGKHLHLSAKTIANYVSLIKNKLGVTTDVELAHLAYNCGILPSSN
ncbi:MAG TPA: response regulator transcription factor [Crenotrichaceae bacterium]|nr:response regulator transcription factor [Crenotrichaceae bacterium]